MDFVYTHTKNSQAVDVIKMSLNIIKNRYSKSVRSFSTNGERLLRRKLGDFMATLGITTERSPLATPAQNGMAECYSGGRGTPRKSEACES